MPRLVNRISWNEYPVMAAVAAIAGIALFLLLQTLGGGPAGEQPLKRAEPASSVEVSPPLPSQVEAARQDRARRRAAARRRARARARQAAAAAAAPAPPAASAEPAGTPGTYRSQPEQSGPEATGEEQFTPAPTPQPAPKAKQPATTPGRSFDDSG